MRYLHEHAIVSVHRAMKKKKIKIKIKKKKEFRGKKWKSKYIHQKNIMKQSTIITCFSGKISVVYSAILIDG